MDHIDLSYTSTDKGQGCGGEFYSYAGKFASINYPKNYRNLTKCEWKVTTPPGTVVSLKFTQMSLGKSALAGACLSSRNNTS